MDWALIAKEWIKMKEDGMQIPPAPIISASDFAQHQDKSGSADMDIADDEDEDNSVADTGAYLNALQQSQVQKNHTISPWANNFVPMQSNPFSSQLQPQSSWKSNSSPWANPNPFPSLTPSIIKPQPNLVAPGLESINIYSIAHDAKIQPAPNISADVWENKSIYHNRNAISPNHEIAPNLIQEDMRLDNSDSEDTTQTIDTKARKLLPAWIREGLEKMEREKQKQAERQREFREREKYLEQRKKEEEAALLELQQEKKLKKFESDENSSDDEEEPSELPRMPEKLAPVPEMNTKRGSGMIVRSREERLQEMMKTVRQTLTEILLDVTNEMIVEISNETISKYRKKAPTVQLRKNVNALTSLAGLEAYSGSSDSEQEDEPEEPDDDDELDSELELKERIKRRSIQFEQKAKEIEERLEEEELREQKQREQLEEEDGKRSSDDDKSETEKDVKPRIEEGKGMMDKYDTIYSISGRMREKRPSRFSDPSDTVRSTHLTHVSISQLSRYHSSDGGGASNGRSLGNASGIVPEFKTQVSTTSTESGGHHSKRSHSSDDSVSSSGSEHRRRKHKKHKKSSKKKHSKSRYDNSDEEYRSHRHERDRDYDHRSHRRTSIESKSSVRSDRSEKSRRHSRSRSRERKHHRY